MCKLYNFTSVKIILTYCKYNYYIFVSIDAIFFVKKGHFSIHKHRHFKDYYELTDTTSTYAEGYGPLFETFYENCGEDVILDMEPLMSREEMHAKTRMHAGITHSENPWPTPRPGNGNRPRMNPPKRNTDSLDQARLRSLDAVIANIRYLQSKSYVK